MKTKIVLLLLLGWVGLVWGQVKLLSDYKSKYPDVSDTKTLNDFIKQVKNNKNREEIIKLIHKNTGLSINEIGQRNVEKEELEYQHTYLLGTKQVFVNLKNDSAFVIKGLDGTKKYFLPSISIFLTKAKQNLEGVIRSKFDSTFCSMRYKCDVKDNDTCNITKVNKLKAVHDSVLTRDLKTLKNAIILNSADNVTSNNAIAFTSGNDSKLSVGANLNNGKRWFLNISAYTSSINSGLFYSDKSWKTDVGGSFTLNKVIFSETRVFDPDKCKKLYDKRKDYYNKVLIQDYEDLNKIDYEEFERLKEERKKIRTRIKYNLKGWDELEDNEEKRNKIENKIEKYEKIVANPYKYINDSIIAFDIKNNILKGSRLHWIKITLDIYNQNVGFDTAKVKNFVSPDDQIKNYIRSNVNMSYNFNQQNTRIFKGLIFKWVNLQVFSNLIMGNLLDANIGSDMPILKEINFETFIVDKNGRLLGKYFDLNKRFWTLQSGIQASAFITDYFGFTVYGYHTFALQNMDYMDYRNRYGLQGGLIFRINDEEDVNKATFRVMAGVENEPYHTRALKNSFMVKVSIGIPFGLFIKSKKGK